MTRSSRVARGVFAGYANQAVVTVVGLWLAPFLLRTLGSAEYGLWLTGLQVLTQLSLLDLGVATVLPRDVGRASGREGGPDHVRSVFRTTAGLVIWQWPLVLVVALVIGFGAGRAWAPASGPVAIVLATYVALFPFRILQGLLTGLQELTYVSVVQTLSWAVTTTVIVLLLVSTDLGLYSMAIGWSVGQLVSVALWMARVARKHRAMIGISWSTTPTSAEGRTLLAKGVWISVSQVAVTFQQGIDLVLIATFAGVGAIVPYAMTKKLVDVLSNQPLMVTATVVPVVSELSSANDSARTNRALDLVRRATLILSGAVAVVVVAVNQGFVTAWVGPTNYAGTSVTLLLIVVMLLRHFNVTVTLTNFAFGHERRLALTAMAEGLAVVCLGSVGAFMAGEIGFLIGSLCSVVFVGLPMNLRTEAEATGHSIGGIIADIVPWGARVLFVLAVVLISTTLWLPTSTASLAVAVLLASCLYIVVMLPLIRRPDVWGRLSHVADLLWRRLRTS